MGKLIHHSHRAYRTVGFGRCPPTKGQMGSLGIVEVDPLTEDLCGFEAVRQLMRIDNLEFERTPQTFVKGVPYTAALPIHGDHDRWPLENSSEVIAGELGP